MKQSEPASPVPIGSIVETLFDRAVGQVVHRVSSGGQTLYQIKLETERITWMESKEFRVVIRPAAR